MHNLAIELFMTVAIKNELLTTHEITKIHATYYNYLLFYLKEE